MMNGERSPEMRLRRPHGGMVWGARTTGKGVEHAGQADGKRRGDTLPPSSGTIQVRTTRLLLSRSTTTTAR